MAAEVPAGDRLTRPPVWALAQVPGLSQGQEPRHVERLAGGTVNNVFHVVSAEGQFVLRLNGAAWRRPGVDRARELQLHRIAAEGGVAPAIVAAMPACQGLLITEYHLGRTWKADDCSDVAKLHRLGERLAVLHRLPAPARPPFDPLQVGHDYVKLIAPRYMPDLAPVMRRLAALCQPLADAAAAPCVVHGDLWEGNLLDGTRLWLLDWEYAQLTEPLMDVACVLAYYPVAGQYRHELMAAADIASASRSGLADRVEIYRILSWLWRLARGEASPPP